MRAQKLNEESQQDWQIKQIEKKLPLATTIEERLELFEALSNEKERQILVDNGTITAAPTADDLKAKDDALRKSLKDQERKDLIKEGLHRLRQQANIANNDVQEETTWL